MFLIGGLFAGYNKIMTFGMPGPLLALIGAGLIAGVGVRLYAAAAAAVLAWFILSKLGGASSVTGYFNSVKREFALLAAAGVLAMAGGGRLFALDRVGAALGEWWTTYASGGQRPATPAHRTRA